MNEYELQNFLFPIYDFQGFFTKIINLCVPKNSAGLLCTSVSCSLSFSSLRFPFSFPIIWVFFSKLHIIAGTEHLSFLDRTVFS